MTTAACGGAAAGNLDDVGSDSGGGSSTSMPEPAYGAPPLDAAPDDSGTVVALYGAMFVPDAAPAEDGSTGVAPAYGAVFPDGGLDDAGADASGDAGVNDASDDHRMIFPAYGLPPVSTPGH